LKNRIHKNKEIQRRKSETLKKTYSENGGLNHRDDCQCGVCKAKRGEYVGEGNPFFGRKETDEHRAKVGDAIRRSFQSGMHGLCDPERQRKRVEKALQSLMENRPTSYEKIVIDVIDRHDLPFEYVGDGKFWITSHGKHINPDFRDTDGSRVVIEVFCDYWKERTYGSVEQYLEERREQCED